MLKKKRNISCIILLITFMFVLASVVSFMEVKSEDTTSPINKNYSLPLQSWTFIQEDNLTVNQITKYQWVSDLSVQGREVTKEQLNTMQGQSLSERFSYFETLGYYSGVQDSGKTTTDINGSIYFVFFNPNSLAADLNITYNYQLSNIQPWVIGLISGIFILLFGIGGVYISARIRRKMIQDEEEEQEPSAAERYMN